MDRADLNLRRATVDDLPGLEALWHALGQPADELEKRLTDFHVAADNQGQIVGAIALEISGQFGKLHSEAVADVDQPDLVRSLLWERIEMVSRYRGLVRLWTLLTSPFWQNTGFKYSTDSEKGRLPAEFGTANQPWRTLKLRDERALDNALEKEIELFKIQNEEQNERIIRNAKVLRAVAILLGVLLFLVVILGVLLLFQMKPQSP